MDAPTAILLGVVGVMAVNQLVMRVGALRGHVAVFWAMQLLNLLVGSAILWFGLPGFSQWPVVSWILGLLFFLRTAQNTSIRTRWLREQHRAEVEAQRQALRQALAAGRDEE